MENLIIKVGSSFYNLTNLTGLSFEKMPWGTYSLRLNGPDFVDTQDFPSEELYEYAQKKLEEGLINNYVFIDLNKN